MAIYYYLPAFHSTKGNVLSTTNINTVPSTGLAIGIGDEALTAPRPLLNYGTVNSIATAIHKLANHARDRGYPNTGTNVHHYAVDMYGTNVSVIENTTDPAQIEHITSIANQAGKVSLYIGEDFHVTNRGQGSAGTLTGFSSHLIDSGIKVLTNCLLDWYLAHKGSPWAYSTAHVPDMIEFNSAVLTAIMGTADSGACTIAFWTDFPILPAANDYACGLAGGVNNCDVLISDPSDLVDFAAAFTHQNSVLSNTIVPSASPQRVMMSTDRTKINATDYGQCYIGGSGNAQTSAAGAPADITFSTDIFTVGGDGATGGIIDKFNGTMGDFVLYDQSFDLSLAANRNALMGAPGAVISNLYGLGVTPVISLTGNAAAWNTGVNPGSGANLVLSGGTITDA